jgi:hypothetical protein
MNIIKAKGLFALLLLTAIDLSCGPARAQYVYTTIDDPVAVANSGSTYVEGIYGNVVVGYYFGPLLHGFYHVLGTTNYVTLDDPVGYTNGSSSTMASGVSGPNIVGTYMDQIHDTGSYGFVYNMVTSNYTTLENPNGVRAGASVMTLYGIDGNNIVGINNAFAPPYNEWQPESFYSTLTGGTYNEFYYPSPSQVQNEGDYSVTNYATFAFGISGPNIAGYWLDQNLTYHAYVYNSVTNGYTPIYSDYGGGAPIYGIYSNTVVGNFADPNKSYNYSGFTFNFATSNYTTFRVPQAPGNVFGRGIYGTTVAGYYIDASSLYHGFVATIPVPVLNIAVVGSNLILTATNGAPAASCFILDSTNPALPLPQWSVLSSNVFNSSGDFSVTNAIAPAMPPTYYELSEVP